jgi:proteasome assembly chaperone (PAC2) family protein|tara:strand:- start:513 stop:725 length:213 start_codon:yes stop_codon:yes gene_type:complete
MKESKLIELKNKVDSFTRVMQEVINKIALLENLLINLTTVIKRLKEYEEIASQLKKESDDRKKDNRKAKG